MALNLSRLHALEPNPLIEGGSNRPLALDDAHTAYRIASGYADVFALDPSGLRRHLFRSSMGALLMGARSDDGSMIAVGSLGSRFEKILLEAAFADPAPLERWIEDMTGASGVQSKEWPSHLIESPIVSLVAGGDYGTAGRSLVWLKVTDGAVRWQGVALPVGAVLPAVAPARFDTPDHGQLSVLAEPDFEERAAAIATLGQIVLGISARAITGERQHSEAGFIGRQQRSDRMLSDALINLVSRSEAHRPMPADPVLAAIFETLIAAGHSLPDIAKPLPADDGGNRLIQLLNALGIPHRPLRLSARWWQRDGLAFLGQSRNGHRISLRPLGNGRWHAKGQGVDGVVTRKLAASISTAAIQLYPMLPDRPLGLGDLSRFGMAGAGRDIRRIAITSMAAALTLVGAPFATGVLFDSVVPLGDRFGLIQILIALCSLALGQGLFELVRALGVARLEARLDASLQAAVMHRLLHLPITFFRQYSVGDLAERTLGLQTIRQIVSGSALAGLFGLIGIVTGFIAMVLIDGRMALFALVPIAIIALISGALAWAQLKHERERTHIFGNIRGFVLQLMVGISKLRSAAAEKRGLAEWAWRSAPQRHAFMRARRLAGWQAVAQSVLVPAALLSIFLLVVVLAKSDATAMAIASLLPGADAGAAPGLSTGSFIAFIAAFGQVAAAMSAAVGASALLLSAEPLLARTRPLLEAVPEKSRRGEDIGRLRGAIEVRQLRFRYRPDSPLALDDVSFAIEPGEYVAIVGASGGGKSTILRLLLGFDRPESGEVFFDGRAIEQLDLAALRAQIGVVLQNGRITVGSMFENIVGASGLGIDDAWAAARLVDLARDIEAMPMGMHTVLTDGGGTLSGGQRQRVLLARSLVRRPNVLLLDEATSALDNRTQATVTQSLARLNVSRIVIAHRLSTIREVDRIIVLEKGRIIETGTYDDLIQANGPFSILARRQLI